MCLGPVIKTHTVTSLVTPVADCLCSEMRLAFKKDREEASRLSSQLCPPEHWAGFLTSTPRVIYLKRDREAWDSVAVLVLVSADRINYGRVAPAAWRTSLERKSDTLPCSYPILQPRSIIVIIVTVSKLSAATSHFNGPLTLGQPRPLLSTTKTTIIRLYYYYYCHHHHHHPLSLLHNSLTRSQSRTRLTDQALLIHCFAKYFLSIRHALSVIAF